MLLNLIFFWFILFDCTIIIPLLYLSHKCFLNASLQDEDAATVYYISFDQFSLVNEKFQIICGKNGKEDFKRLKSISISEVGIPTEDLYNPTSRPSKNIVEVLMVLRENHVMKFHSHNSVESDDTRKKQKSNPQVHFLFDEVPQEIFCSSYSAELAKGLDTNFKNSTVVIAFQSVKKVREIQSADIPNKPLTNQMDIKPLINSGVKLFELKNCIRMSTQLHKLQKNLEAEAEKTPFQANLTYKKQTAIGQLMIYLIYLIWISIMFLRILFFFIWDGIDIFSSTLTFLFSFSAGFDSPSISTERKNRKMYELWSQIQVVNKTKTSLSILWQGNNSVFII